LTADLTRERGAAASMRMEVDELRTILSADSKGKPTRDGGAGGKGGHLEIEHKILTLKNDYEANKVELEALQAAHKSLTLAHTKAGNIAARVQQERDSLDADAVRLKKALALLRSEHAEARENAARHAEQNETLRSQLATLTADHTLASKRLPLLEASLSKSEKDRSKIKKQLDEVWSEKEDLLLQLAELKADVSLAEKKREILAEKAAAAPPVDPKTTSALAAAQAERDSLTRQLFDLSERTRGLEAQLADSENSCARWSAKYDQAKADKAALQAEMETVTAEAQRLATALKAAQGDQSARDAALKATEAKLAAAGSGASAELAAARKAAETNAAATAAAEAALAPLRAELEAQATAHAKALADLKAQSDARLGAQLAEAERAQSASSRALLESQHKVAELEGILDQPRLSGADLARLAKREAELQATVAKLVVNEEASEASFTCFACMSIFTAPVTCIPCGHSWCQKCIEQAGNMCTMCKPANKVSYYRNELLEELASRFIFRKQALQTLRDMTAQSAASAKGR
jgi:chromosome segregation ATPase